MAYLDAKDVQVLVLAEPIVNVTTLTCRLHDVQVPGTYYKAEDSDEEYIACVIPSLQYLQVESVSGFPDNWEFGIEVSLNNGLRYTDDGLNFKFIDNNQTNAIDINVGPESGGTVI